VTLAARGRRKALAWAAVAAVIVAALGSVATDTGPWYQQLKQPVWKPPDGVFGAVWTVIYACAVIAASYAWAQAPSRRHRITVLALFALNAVLNLAWSLLFFRSQRPDWALWEVFFLWGSVLLLMAYTARFSPRCAWLLVPYLMWVAIAAALNREVVALNGPFG
jgi:translocator protein